MSSRESLTDYFQHVRYRAELSPLERRDFIRVMGSEAYIALLPGAPPEDEFDLRLDY